MPFTLEIDGFDELLEKLERLERRDQQPLQEGIVTILRNDVLRRFLTSPPTTSGGIVHGGAYWRALKEGYLRSRPDRVLGQVLIDTGAMRDSFLPFAPNSYVEYTTDTIIFGSDDGKIEELNDTWAILFFHEELMEKISRWIVQYYTEDKEFPDEF